MSPDSHLAAQLDRLGRDHRDLEDSTNPGLFDPPEPIQWRGDVDPCLDWDAADRARDNRIADQLEGR